MVELNLVSDLEIPVIDRTENEVGWQVEDLPRTGGQRLTN
jgi:hypothetical protein